MLRSTTSSSPSHYRTSPLTYSIPTNPQLTSSLPLVLLPNSSDGSYPTVSSHTGEWSLDPAAHALEWKVACVSPDDETRSGSLIFSVGGTDTGAFFPVEVVFVGQGSLAGVGVERVERVDGGESPVFSVDGLVGVDEYLVV